MAKLPDFIDIVRQSAEKRILFLSHAVRQMSRPDRMISPYKDRKMNCVACKGKMKRGLAPFHIDRKGYHLLFDAIPAWICSQCGEPYFDEGEVELIQEMLKVLDKRTKELSLSA